MSLKSNRTGTRPGVPALLSLESASFLLASCSLPLQPRPHLASRWHAALYVFAG